MPEPQEQDPSARRFERIEAAHEFLTGIVTGIAVTQQKLGEAQVRAELALTGAVETMERSHQQLLTAQVLMVDAQTKADERIARLAEAQAETQGKLDVLIHMWDDWINDRAGRNGRPAPEPPPAA